MSIDLQPKYLRNELVILSPLQPDEFEQLYAVASDPLIWEQHPNPDRYKRPVFENFFKGAIESKGAFMIKDISTEQAIGCTRFYDLEADQKRIKIGYTFFARSCWGRGYNQAVKTLMLNHAFSFADLVLFHVGENNTRSRIAMERLGAELMAMEEVAYFGEASRMNCLYGITKGRFLLM